MQSQLKDLCLEASDSLLREEAIAGALRGEAAQATAELAQTAVFKVQLQSLQQDNVSRRMRTEQMQRELNEESALQSAFRGELAEQRAQTTAVSEANIAAYQAVASRAEAQAAEETAVARRLEESAVELKEQLKSQDECWKKMFNQYHVIGQVLFGGPQPSGEPEKLAPTTQAPMTQTPTQASTQAPIDQDAIPELATEDPKPAACAGDPGTDDTGTHSECTG